MNKIDCDITNDLLPLYVEDIVSDASKKAIEEHINSCDLCRKNLESMKKVIHIPIENDKKTFEKIRKKIIKNKIMLAFLSCSIAIILVVLAIINLTSPIQVNYNSEIIKVEANDDGSLLITIGDEVDNYKLEKIEETNTPEDMTKVTYSLSCWQTKWDRLFTEHKQKTVTINEDCSQIIENVYYLDNDNDTCSDIKIYSRSNDYSISEGMMTLPRLTLNYYFLVTGVLTFIGVLLLVVFRKKNIRDKILKITLVPAVYVVSSILVLWGKRDIYNTKFYFSRIVFLTILMYIIFYNIIKIKLKKLNCK